MIQYLNPVAQMFLQAPQQVKCLNAGRGFGKSHLYGPDINLDLKHLPRAKGLFLGLTYSQILSNTLLPITSALESYGYKRDIHYVIGKKPPKWFDHPYQKPERYENVMSFWNGYTIILASFDRPQLLRGGSNDFVKVDEALLVKKERFDEVIIPTLRPSHVMLKGKQRLLHQHFTTSMPYGNNGDIIWHIEEKSKRNPKQFFYTEGSSWHNVDILGKETILMWKESMTKSRYEIEVMGKRIRNVGDMFYPKLSDKHYYDPSDNHDFIDGFDYDLTAISQVNDCRMDADLDTGKPMHLSFDFGTFSCMVVAQDRGDDFPILNSFYVKSPETVNELVDKFCEYYQYQANKTALIWGDKGGIRRDERSYINTFDMIIARMSKHGWRCVKKKTADIEHWERHKFINEVLDEHGQTFPKIKIQKIKNKDLIIALESAGMIDRKKDKSSERKAIAQEHATHFTDAFDYLVYHCFKSKVSTLSGLYV